MWKFFHQLASPPYLYGFAGRMIPWFGIPAAVLLVIGSWLGLFDAPPDYQQGDGFRIIYVHVPAAYLSLMVFTVMAIASAIGLIWRIKLAHAVASGAAPIGASFTFLALVTGSIWGRPMWGTWWEWGDPRLTSELILLFLYFGYMALRASISERGKADKASALLALVGVVNIPIIHYSVEWWSSLHQGSTLLSEGGPKMPPSMLVPLLVMILAFTLFFATVLCQRLRGEILDRERNSRWIRRVLLEDATPGGDAVRG